MTLVLLKLNYKTIIANFQEFQESMDGRLITECSDFNIENFHATEDIFLQHYV